MTKLTTHSDGNHPEESTEMLQAELHYHPLSFCDERGRLFWRGDELCRGISPPYVEFYQYLFKTGIVDELVERRMLVETWQTDVPTPEYPVVVKHRTIPFVSYANEWASEMLKDAGLLLLDIVEYLLERDLLLMSANPWSVLFDGTQPLLVDFCDIIPLDSQGRVRWEVFEREFFTDFLQPLELMAEGKGALARWILSEYEHQDVHRQFAEAMRYRNGMYAPPRFAGLATSFLGRIVRKLRAHRADGADRETLKRTIRARVQRLKAMMERLSLPTLDGTPPRKMINPVFSPDASWTSKQTKVFEHLSRLRPTKVIDLGAGTGWYAMMAAALGARTVALDLDERNVNQCYRQAKAQQLNVLPLVMDLKYPTPGYGIANTTLPPATQRLAADVVLALGLVHHLALEQVRPFELVAQAIGSFTTRWAIIEFALPEDEEVAPWITSSTAWYSLKRWQMMLEREFRVLSVVPSHPSSRLLFLCEKKGKNQ
jgi:SAM-dependent methyltransferase